MSLILRFNEQKEYLERLLSIQEKLYGANDGNITPSLSNLAQAYSKIGEHGKSRDFLERGLKIENKIYGPNHIHISFTLNRLGEAYAMCLDELKEKAANDRALSIKTNLCLDNTDFEEVKPNLWHPVGHCTDVLSKSVAFSIDPSVEHLLSNIGTLYGIVFFQ